MKNVNPNTVSYAAPTAGMDWFEEFASKPAILQGQDYQTAKRVMDVALVMALSPLWVPIMIVCATIVWLSSPLQSPFFAQKRTGFAGRLFTMYKIRTMVPNAHMMTAEVRHLSRYSEGFDIKIPGDPRITRAGKFLRATHLDELPQLLNVLAGDMSLVGPRPTSYSPECYSLWHTKRLEVPPGITGIWQIIQLDVPEIDDKVRLDIAYIDRACLWLDCQILVGTLVYILVCALAKKG